VAVYLKKEKGKIMSNLYFINKTDLKYERTTGWKKVSLLKGMKGIKISGRKVHLPLRWD
jgi:hypothetical protein